MKRKNNKGFTLIEILAAVVILGIISAIAVPAVYKYVTKTKDFSYENMYKTVYDAVKNYRINTNDDSVKGFSAPTYTKADINNLVELNYLDPLVDPADKSKKCSAEVYVFDCADKDKTVLKDHSYSVQLTCSAHSGTKTFNDNGDLMSSSEYGTCVGGGSGTIGDFTIEGADLKYENQNGDDYDGSWTNKKIWIGNITVEGINSSNIDHFEYTTDYNNISFNAKSESFGSNAKSYTFDGETDIKFRIRAVDKNGKVSAWSDKTFQVRIDQISPEVTMSLINSNNDFTSPVYDGTATSNTYTYDGWVGKSGSATPNVRISATDNKSGVNEKLQVNYNTSGDFGSNPNTNWNGVSGSKKFDSNNVFTANGLDDGFRVIECSVTDKAGNITKGTIRVKIDKTPPKLNLSFFKTSDGNTFETYSCEGKNTCNYEYSGWITSKLKDGITVSDTGSGIVDKPIAKYNAAGQTSYVTTIANTYERDLSNDSSSSKNIADGYRYLEYSVKDRAGNTTTIIFKGKIDTVVPDISTTFMAGSKTIFTADSANTKTETAANSEYEYGYWINSKNAITNENLVVNDAMSGAGSVYRVLYKSSGEYSNETKQSDRTFVLSNGSGSATYSDGVANGYRTAVYTVSDMAGNARTFTVKFKVDKTPPNTVSGTNPVGVSITYGSGTTADNVRDSWTSNTYTTDSSINLKISAQDSVSGVSGYFDVGYNTKGMAKGKCSTKNSLTTYTYSYSSTTYDADGIATKKTRDIKNALAIGCRYFVVTLRDVAGNTKEIPIIINRESSDNSTTDTKTDSDTNPDGCTYVDYDIRNTGYQWQCDAGHYHTTAHFIVCKEGNNYYAKKGYYVLKGWKGNKSPTLICPQTIGFAAGKYVDGTYKILNKGTNVTYNNSKFTYSPFPSKTS